MEQYHDSMDPEQRLSAPSWPQPSQIIFPQMNPPRRERGEDDMLYYRYYGPHSGRKHVFAQGGVKGRIARPATRRETVQA